MTDELQATAATPDARSIENSAGAMLRQAREAQGLHIAMLATTMKVTPRKLEALEADRLEELPDLAFARALAQTVCRTLKVDPEPILAKMPSLGRSDRLEHTANGMKEPFRERGDSHTDAERWTFLRQPAFWVTLVILAAAAMMMWMPGDWVGRIKDAMFGARTASSPSSTSGMVSTSVPSPGASTRPQIVSQPIVVAPAAPTDTARAAGEASGAAMPSVTVVSPSVMGPQRDTPSGQAIVVETVHSAPTQSLPGTAASSPGLANPTVPGVLVFRAKAEAWVDVQDGAGKVLLARSLHAGEAVSIDGAPPFKLKLGNTTSTEVRYRGELVDVTTKSVGNMLRLELK